MSAGILVNVPIDHAVAQEELFGPIAMVFKADDIDAAIRLANDVPFGLGSSVWTEDADERERFEREIEAAMLFSHSKVGKMVFNSQKIRIHC